jgi:hypothetical protein
MFPGRYYYLSTEEDINSSIGDCMGAVNNIVAYQFTVEPKIPGNKNIYRYLPGIGFNNWKCAAYTGSVAMETESANDISLGVLSQNERHTLVLLLFPETNTLEIPTTMEFHISYKDSKHNLVKMVRNAPRALLII